MRQALGLTRLALLPVARQKVAPGLPPVRSGGSYLKLFPGTVALRAMTATAAGGLTPLVYLHPYEFVADRSFFVSGRDLAPLPPRARAYWTLRQSQWHVVGNRGVMTKLRRIARDWTFAGPMRGLLVA